MIVLTGLKVLVTGGSRGIGAACARLFAQAGADVLIHYRQRSVDAEALLETVQSLDSGDHRVFAADLAEAQEVDRLFEFLRSEWSGLDALVNNAGIWERNALADLDRRSLSRTLAINVSAPILCMASALPLLSESKRAAVVNISSTAGQRGEAYYSPYAASKGAMIAVTKSWAAELAPGIRVNAVAPGWVDTELCEEPFRHGGRDKITAGIPLGRVATPEDIAGSVLFLASPLARHITGEVINVNGGSVLCG